MIEIEQTADGSNTLYVPLLNEHYHSVKGALTESEHIFIGMGLKHCEAPRPQVLEIGFGTGLNAFLTLIEAEDTQKDIRFTTLERYPVAEDMLKALSYPERICPERRAEFYALHTAPWEEDVVISPHFTLHKQLCDFTLYQADRKFDVIYFDAFAPEKQPEMWTPALFRSLFAGLNPKGILVTYCAKGVVRRMLQDSGFIVERLPGPPGGKREILRATKPE